MKKILILLFVTLITACSDNSNKNAEKMNTMSQATNELKYDSIDEIQGFLKDLYNKNGLAGVKQWITDNIKDGTKLTLTHGPSGQANQQVIICDRRMETLDKNGINITNEQYLPFISQSLDYQACDLYFSLRVLFVPEPFGIVVHKKVNQ